MYVYYINVPLNEEGMKEFESYDEEMPNVETFELVKEEYDLLRKKGGLFDKLDAELGIIIAVCEEERIEFSQLEKAITITETYCKKKLSEQEKKACGIIAESLKTAKNSGTFWEIDIYLE
jgi:hypothetical protein